MSGDVPIPLAPFVGASALGVIATITMFSLHPVIAATSLVGALLCSLALMGPSATVRGLRWQLPAIVLVALVNPLFSASGSTVAWRLGPVVFYVESLAFGLAAGCVMVASLLWLTCLAKVVPLSAVRMTLGRWVPTVALAVTMTLRLVPLLRDRYAQVAEARVANTASRSSRPLGPLAAAVLHSGVLLGWTLEESLTRADAMRARGWGVAARRSSYRRDVLRSRDAVVLALLLPLACASAALSWVACSQWHFYPTMPHLVVWWGYVPFAALCALPSLVLLTTRLRWLVRERRGRGSQAMPISWAGDAREGGISVIGQRGALRSDVRLHRVPVGEVGHGVSC